MQAFDALLYVALLLSTVYVVQIETNWICAFLVVVMNSLFIILICLVAGIGFFGSHPFKQIYFLRIGTNLLLNPEHSRKGWRMPTKLDWELTLSENVFIVCWGVHFQQIWHQGSQQLTFSDAVIEVA